MEQGQFPFFIGVHKALSITPSRYQQLKSYFQNDWKAVFESSITQLQESGLGRDGIEKFLTTRKEINPEQEVEKLEQLNVRTIIYGEQDYPPSLENISSPPMVLFIRGEWSDSYFPSISVVGSRGITSYGKRALDHIVGTIADAGVTIVSGLALGADTCAHRTAIEHGAKTICVLGNGINWVYPQQNQKLADEILSQNKGCLVSEYFPGVASLPGHFPVRNRIVAGLSKATIVIEAAQKSGSLITARMALDSGRDVFAVPGDIFARFSQGCNDLILNGEANPVLSGDQVLQTLGFSHVSIQKELRQKMPVTEIEQQVFDLFGNEQKMHIDDLIRNTSLKNSVLTSTVSLMEIKGLLKNIGNQTYLKNV
jgi:DNA processing protein